MAGDIACSGLCQHRVQLLEAGEEIADSFGAFADAVADRVERRVDAVAHRVDHRLHRVAHCAARALECTAHRVADPSPIHLGER